MFTSHYRNARCKSACGTGRTASPGGLLSRNHLIPKQTRTYYQSDCSYLHSQWLGSRARTRYFVPAQCVQQGGQGHVRVEPLLPVEDVQGFESTGGSAQKRPHQQLGPPVKPTQQHPNRKVYTRSPAEQTPPLLLKRLLRERHFTKLLRGASTCW